MGFVQLTRSEIEKSLKDIYGFQRVSDLQLDIIVYLQEHPGTQDRYLINIVNNGTTKQNFYSTMNKLREKGTITEDNRVIIRKYKPDDVEWPLPAQIRERKIPNVDYCEKMNYYYLNTAREIAGLSPDEREKALERFKTKEQKLMQDDPDFYNNLIYKTYDGLAFFSLMSGRMEKFL